MKKHLLIGAVLIGGLAMAQNVKGVGIETNNPTETLHVEGTARVVDLPVNEEGKIYTKSGGEASSAKDQRFNAVNTVVVNEEGVLGVIPGLPAAEAGKYENEDGTEVFVPEKKCAKNVIGDGSVIKDNPKVMVFDKAGYKFTWYDKGVGKVQLDVQRTPEYASQPRKAKSTWWFNEGPAYGGVRGDFTVTASPERVFDSSFRTSTAARVYLIMAHTAQTFIIDFTSLNQDNVKVMNICIEQTVF